MKSASFDPLQRWAHAWETAGDFLERERAQRLRAMTDDEARRAIASLFFDDTVPRGAERQTGLIEQQRLYRKLK